MHEEPPREVRRRIRAWRLARLTPAQRRAAMLLRVGMSDEEARRADGGRILAAVIAAGMHRVSEGEATRRTPAGTTKALRWMAEDLTLLSARRAGVRDVRRWLAMNAPGLLAERLAAWAEATPYRPAGFQRHRWASPDAPVARWERRRDALGARP